MARSGGRKAKRSIAEAPDRRWGRGPLRYALAALVISAAVIALFIDRRSTGRNQAHQAPPVADLPAAAAHSMAPLLARADDPPWPDVPQPADVGVVIDEVTVDKQEVCRGEEAIVSVRARAIDGGKEFLSIGVVGQPELIGPRFPLRLQESFGDHEMRVFARGKNGTATTAAVPPIVVKDCDLPVTVGIDYRRDAAAPDRAWLTARVETSADAPAFKAARYLWDFGDGRTEVTTTPQVEHGYEGRLQDVAYSYFFVTVTAQDASGREVLGSRALRFVNLGFGTFAREKRVTIFAGVKENAGGGEKIWLYHGAPAAVRLDEVVVTDTILDSNSNETVIARHTHDPASLLGFRELPPGSSLDVADLRHLRPTTPDVARVLEISGHTQDGKPASGAFNLLAFQPAPAPAPDSPN